MSIRVDGTVRERLEAHRTIQDAGYTTPCWLSDYRTSHDGYPQMGIGRAMPYVHRVAWEEYVGPIPEGLQVDHLCRVRRCFNPSHLEPVTGRTNLMRSTNHVAKNPAKTACPKGHSYDEVNTLWYKGTRRCRACARDSKRAQDARRRAERQAS